MEFLISLTVFLTKLIKYLGYIAELHINSFGCSKNYPGKLIVLHETKTLRFNFKSNIISISETRSI